ncbi:hypothetical protein ACFU6M_14470 [Streptomyces bottropensis]|uniref:hypothetical protein n=1 Tax=Streptomyces bottropensis TaxID=42235 RepID=UPI00367D92E0
MSEQTPSQAEGERQPDVPADDEKATPGRRDVPRTTPSQAEGDDAQSEDDEGGESGEGADGEGAKRTEAWESGWSGP